MFCGVYWVMHDAVKVMVPFCGFERGLWPTKKRNHRRLVNETEDFAGNWMGKNAFLKSLTTNLINTYWLELLKVDEMRN